MLTGNYVAQTVMCVHAYIIIIFCTLFPVSGVLVIIISLPVALVTMPPIPVVEEGSGSVEVCLEVLSPTIPCPIAFPFEFIVHTFDGTAGSYTYVSMRSCFFILFSLHSLWYRLFCG